MTHKSCYGTIFPPNLIRSKMNRRVSGKVFAYETRLPGGIGDADRETFVDPDEWDACLACEEFEHCYRLCLAKLVFDHAVGR